MLSLEVYSKFTLNHVSWGKFKKNIYEVSYFFIKNSNSERNFVEFFD